MEKHNEKEIVSYIASLNFITNSLLEELENIHKSNEQYFEECSVLGVDRLGLLKSIKELLINYREDTLKKCLNFQQETGNIKILERIKTELLEAQER